MRDRIYEKYLLDAGREDLVSSIDFLEREYGAEFKFIYDEYVSGRIEAVGCVEIRRGFELDGITPARQYDDIFFRGSAIIQRDMNAMMPRDAQMKIVHFTRGVAHLSEVTETIIRKVVDDIPSVKTKVRMLFEVSGSRVPWYLRKDSPC